MEWWSGSLDYCFCYNLYLLVKLCHHRTAAVVAAVLSFVGTRQHQLRRLLQRLPYLHGHDARLSCREAATYVQCFTDLIGCWRGSDHSRCFVVYCAFGPRFTPLSRVCRICKTKVNQEHHYCQECAFSKGALMCSGVRLPCLLVCSKTLRDQSTSMIH